MEVDRENMWSVTSGPKPESTFIFYLVANKAQNI